MCVVSMLPPKTQLHQKHHPPHPPCPPPPSFPFSSPSSSSSPTSAGLLRSPSGMLSSGSYFATPRRLMIPFDELLLSRGLLDDRR